MRLKQKIMPRQLDAVQTDQTVRTLFKHVMLNIYILIEVLLVNHCTGVHLHCYWPIVGIF